MVAQIILIIGRKILFAFNIISWELVKSKGIAKIIQIITNSLMIDFIVVCMSMYW